MEYLVFEVIELAANEAKKDKKNRINPNHIMSAIRNDEELSKYFANGDFCNAGFVPKVKNANQDGKKKKIDYSDSD